MFHYLDPRAQQGLDARPYTLRLAPTAVASPRITLLSNVFTDASAFLSDLERALLPLVPRAVFQHCDKWHKRLSTVAIEDERLAQICGSSDAVVTAYGHCGSCTNGTVRDAVKIARAGLPVVTLVTIKFMEEAQFIARALGITGLPFVFLPHPVAGRDTSFHRALANAIAQPVLEALVYGTTTDANALCSGPLPVESAAA
jgi:hypothetical protein